MYGSSLVEILDVKIIPAGDSSFGQVKGGYLSIEGKFAIGKYVHNPLRDGDRNLQLLSKNHKMDGVVHWDNEVPELDTLWQLLFLSYGYDFDPNGKRYIQLEGLVIKATGAKAGEYRRWGYFEVCHYRAALCKSCERSTTSSINRY
jgi:hypothetical protein